MASIKDLNRKIQSLKSMRKITRAMKMISATKLRKAQDKLVESNKYKHALDEMISLFAGTPQEREHPLFRNAVKLESGEPKSVLVLITADRGLCGSFNGALFREADAYLRKKKEEGFVPAVITIGKKGHEYYKSKSWEKISTSGDAGIQSFDFSKTENVAMKLMADYTSGTVQEVALMYTEFRSAISFVPQTVGLLPVASKNEKKSGSGAILIEPDEDIVLDKLAKRAVSYTIFHACQQSSTAEHAARMSAMDSATRNTNDLIDSTTLQKNKLRQAVITRELVEIVSGAESIKG
ncbi:MAG: ATP synthase F1 subunit gamma [Fibrobacteres bacterium]|nr:ATP synthase F1 subunit gamma [Fibrobacterota bacterium]